MPWLKYCGIVFISLFFLVLVVFAIIRFTSKKNKIKIDDTFITNIINILGGTSNIIGAEVDNARLKIKLVDVKIPNFEELKLLSTKGVFITGNYVKVLFKFDSNEIKKQINERL